jgi:C1A family cysteine protease
MSKIPNVNLSLIPSPPNSNDKIIYHSGELNYGSFVDLSNMCSPIKSQGSENSCTSFAVIAAMEYLENAITGNLLVFSERFTYWVTRVNILNWQNNDTGAYIRSALDSVVRYGTCLNSTFPYNGDYKQQPNQNAYIEAKKYEALAYARFEEGRDRSSRMEIMKLLKANLFMKVPIIAGIKCYQNTHKVINGIIPNGIGNSIGGHAILIVGYDDSKQLLKIRNSWGPTWGDKGYGYLSYDYFLDGNMYDLWSIYVEEIDHKNIGIETGIQSIKKKITLNELSDLLYSISNQFEASSDISDIKKHINYMFKKYNENDDIKNLLQNISDLVDKCK